MNCKKRFREIGKGLAIVAAFCGWLFGLRLAKAFFYDEILKQWSPGWWVANLVLSIVGAAVGGLSIWFSYKFLEWFILGFVAKSQKTSKNKE